MEPHVTTVTIMSVTSTGIGTVAISSRVVEPVSSALRHLEGMSDVHGEPVYVATAEGWRWSWEYVTPAGARCVDTVRIF